MNARIEKQDNRLNVIGELNSQTVPKLWRESSAVIKSAGENLLFDLQGVSRSDSAGVALLIDWMRQARACALEIRFRNLPEQMLDIIKVSDLESVIPLAE
ncbi:MAG: STAS domain-containing protein [Gammaproteobacteria bacterium]|nr:STAS domain-containing protein [Gammaproteobacteria bacterium]MDH5653632.1 STAS domain-containing protein [Gammaproteobacteria bacterium]